MTISKSNCWELRGRQLVNKGGMHMAGSEVHCKAVRQHLAGDSCSIKHHGKCMLLVVMAIAVDEEAVMF